MASGSVTITKASSVPAATPLFPGDIFTYTTTVTNPATAGTNPLTGIAIYDALPTGLSMVAGTTSLNRSTVGDSFNSQAYTLNVGTRNWAGNWTEAGDTGGGATNGSAVQGDIQIVGTELSLSNANSQRENHLARRESHRRHQLPAFVPLPDRRRRRPRRHFSSLAAPPAPAARSAPLSARSPASPAPRPERPASTSRR